MGNQVPCDSVFWHSETKPPYGSKHCMTMNNEALNYEFTFGFIFLKSHIFFLWQYVWKLRTHHYTVLDSGTVSLK